MSLFLSLTIISLFWGLGNVLVKKGFKSLTPWQTYALDALVIAFPLWIGYGIIAGGDLSKTTFFAWLVAFFLSSIYAVYYHTISIGPIGLTSPIIATYPIFTLILAYLFLHERLTIIASLGIVLTMIGVILISLPAKIKFRLEKWLFLSLLVALGYGVSSYFGKIVLSKIDNATYLMVLAITQVIVVTVWRIFIHDPLPIISKIKKSGYSIFGIILFNIGNIIYYIALEKGLASIVVPLSNTYISLIVILSLVWLHEKITRIQLAGIASIVVGVILVGLNINSSAEQKLPSTVPLGGEITIAPKATPSSSISNYEKAKVAFVYDGDTIELTNGYKVRYIGINTPEINSKKVAGECFGKEAWEINKQLVNGQTIEMVKDISETDKYGRLLRYVWIDNVFINDFLIRQGYARIESIPPDIRYSSKLQQSEQEAKENKRGIWKNCQY